MFIKYNMEAAKHTNTFYWPPKSHDMNTIGMQVFHRKAEKLSLN